MDPVDQVLTRLIASDNRLNYQFKDAMKDYMGAVAHHESKGKYDAIQDTNGWLPGGKNGVGRGAYQFEIRGNRDKFLKKNGKFVLDKNGNKQRLYYGAESAINRTIQMYNNLGFSGKWLRDLKKNGIDDFSTLKKYQQDILFIGDKYGSPDNKLSDISNAYLSPDATKHQEYARIWGEGHFRDKDAHGNYTWKKKLPTDHGYHHLRGAK